MSLLAMTAAQAGTMGPPSVTPDKITAGASTAVTVSVSITDPKYQLGSANVLRVKADGSSQVLGAMRDDGQQGDAVAGDQVYTLRVNLQEPSAGVVNLQVSAAYKQELKRTLSALLPVTVESAQATPTVTGAAISPAVATAGSAQSALVTARINDARVIAGSVVLQKLNVSNAVIGTLGNLNDEGRDGDGVGGDKTFSLRTTVLENTPGALRYRVAAAFQGYGQTVYSEPFTLAVNGTATGVSISSPANGSYINTPVITLVGTVGDVTAQVKVNGIAAPLSGNQFAVSVPLNEGPNTVTAVASNSNGSTTSSSIQVTLDTTAPRIEIYSPAANGTTAQTTATVSGMVNDIVVGTVNPQQATVTVNGVAAEVLNRTFVARNVPLNLGSNQLQAVATDRAGNRTTITSTVQRISNTQAGLTVLSGNGQSGRVGTQLASPLVVKLVNSQGQGMPGKPVVFRVIAQDGLVSPSGNPGTGLSAVAINTDAQGQARVFFQLGSRSGAGNNLVEASASGVSTTADFSASGQPGPANLVVVDSGNNQTGVVGQPLPLPFIAIVTDANNNRLANVPVTFAVKDGNGSFGNAGATTLQTTSDGDGRVAATLVLGPNPGVNNNVVELSFAGNPGYAAAFAATGLVPGPASETRISGVVLDNSNQPIPGVTLRLLQITQGNASNIPQEMATAVRTDAQGQFLMQPVPVGIFKLMVDGGTASRPGLWPTLDLDMITVPGQNNVLGMPIYLPELNPSNRVCVNETTGGTLTLPEAPGFALQIAPGSATFPGGSRSGCVFVTPVNMDKVPMSPGFGQQPRFVVTIQPVGTHFNPPARMSIPNVDGLAPRAVTEMYSYDHDLASFVAIGSATVSPDGSTITSDVGAGVIKAGWHCGGNPNSSGSAGTCGMCKKCQGASCAPDNSQVPPQDSPTDCKEQYCSGGGIASRNKDSEKPEDKCKVCKNGKQENIELDTTNREYSYQFSPYSGGVQKINDSLEKLKKFGIIATVNLAQVTGKLSEKECCGKDTGKGKEISGSVSANFGGFNVKGKIWPIGPIPTFGPKTVNIVGIAEITVKAEFVGGAFVGLVGSVVGEVGYRKKECSDDAADRAGCTFASLNIPLTPSISLEAGGTASLTFDCIFCDVKRTITGEGSLVLGEFSWPFYLSEATWNKEKCSDGLAGGELQWDSNGKLKVLAKISGSYQAEGGPQHKFERTFEFVSCSIGSAGLNCD
ncbi:MAG: hypothetical protein CFE41_21690 [Burkholderiales bacterium PBB2]|nr:MAG: hypothetical protein CFE41_21690 [Burkholderiales bacterium PBB2]